MTYPHYPTREAAQKACDACLPEDVPGFVLRLTANQFTFAVGYHALGQVVAHYRQGVLVASRPANAAHWQRFLLTETECWYWLNTLARRANLGQDNAFYLFPDDLARLPMIALQEVYQFIEPFPDGNDQPWAMGERYRFTGAAVWSLSTGQLALPDHH